MSELLRVEFRIVMLDHDEHGVACNERPIAEGKVLAAGLDELPDKVRELAADDIAAQKGVDT